MWKCQCDCGTTLLVRSQFLKNGHTKSCGCYRKESLSEQNTVYKTNEDKELRIRYKGMIQRCYNENAKNYKHYGGRGIFVCDEWKNDFFKFKEWSINNGYSKELTLDRIDVDSEYSPENCRWVSWKTQQNNRRNNKRYEVRGEKLTASELSDKYELPLSTIKSRIRTGKSAEQSILKN